MSSEKLEAMLVSLQKFEPHKDKVYTPIKY